MIPISLYAPARRVYVVFEDGEDECVAIQDTLEPEEANDFRETWQDARLKPIVSVLLTTPQRNIIYARYDYPVE